jgi:hypothetical protein
MKGREEMNKRCSKCGEIKELNELNFAKKNTGKDGFDSQCKECKRAYDKERYEKKRAEILKQKKEYYNKNAKTLKEKSLNYYSKNKEKCKESNSKWQKENPTKRRLINAKLRTFENGAESTLTETEWNAVSEYFNNSCAYCGMTEKESLKVYGELLHHEHVIPLVDGGAYSLGNIVPSCRSCNSSKMNHDFYDWYPTSNVYDSIREKKIIRYLNKCVEEVSKLPYERNRILKKKAQQTRKKSQSQVQAVRYEIPGP